MIQDELGQTNQIHKYYLIWEAIQKLLQQFQSKEIIYCKLIKIIRASAKLENFEMVAGKAMLALRKMFKIIQNENFSNIRLQESSLKLISFVNCNFQGSQMENVKLVSCLFIGCCLDNVNWKKMISFEQTTIFDKSSQIITHNISPDEAIIASGHQDKTIQLWDLKTYQKQSRIKIQNEIYQIGFFWAKYLVVRVPYWIQIWSINSKKKLKQYQNNEIYSDPLFHGLIMHQKHFNKICLFSIVIRKIFRKFTTSFPIHNNIAFSSQSLLMVILLDNKIMIWDFQKGRQYFETTSNFQALSTPSVSPQRDFLSLVANLWGKWQVQVWDIKSKIQIRTIETIDYNITKEFSTNGQIIAYLDGSKNLYFYDILKAQLILKFYDVQITKFDLLLYPKTNFIMGKQKQNFVLLDTRTKQQPRWLLPNLDDLSQIYMYFSSDGKQLLVVNKKNQIQIVDLYSRKNYQKKSIAGAIQIFCSHDLQTLAFYKRGQKIVYLYNIKQERISNQLKYNVKVNAIAISPDNQTLACGNQDCTIRLFNIKTLEQLQIYLGHIYEIRLIIFSENGQCLASFDRSTIRIWNIGKHQLEATLKQSTEKYVAAFSPNSNLLASSSEQKIILWDMKNKVQLQNLESKGNIKNILFLNEQLILKLFCQNTCQIQDLKTGNIISKFDYKWSSIQFSVKNNILAATCGQDLEVSQIYNEKTTSKLITYKSSVISIKTCSKNQTLVTHLQDFSLNIWDIEQNLHKKQILEKQSIINSFSLSKSGNTLAYGCKDSTIYLWDIKSLCCTNKFTSHKGQINSIDFSDNEMYLVSGYQNGIILLWNMKQQKQNSNVTTNHQFPTTQVIFSKDRTIYFWNIKLKLHELGYYKHSGEINLAALSLDQQTLAFGSTDGKVFLLNVENKTITQEFAFHNDKVNCVAFSQDGKYVASGSDDESVCLIDINDGRLVDRFFINEGKVSALTFLYGKQVIVSGNENGGVNMIQFDQKKISLIQIYGKNSLSLKGIKSSFSNAKITSSNGFDLIKLLKDDQ